LFICALGENKAIITTVYAYNVHTNCQPTGNIITNHSQITWRAEIIFVGFTRAGTRWYLYEWVCHPECVWLGALLRNDIFDCVVII